ncbi:MAG TPA: sugar-binding domain-containing protein [Bacillota bacterium]|nr:sugar-binding domain-containing protein [Bacillota bacterium]HPL52611.1 sugar-binding domain-containing protein [Bacillota bacterium]
MHEFLNLQKRLVPEVIDIAEKRYSILRAIAYSQPVGRRALAALLGQSERWVRSELDILKNQNLICIQALGMIVTDEGNEVINKLRGYISELKGLKDIESAIKELLEIKECIVVPGDIKNDIQVLAEMGKMTFEYIKRIIEDNNVIAVSGGYSTLAVAENSYKADVQNVTVVPARGGIKADLERQANIVAAKMARSIGGNYYLLHLPDNISEDMLNRMSDDPDIAKVLSFIANTDILIYGLSSFESICRKRNYTEEEIERLKALNVRAEALGCFFDENGGIVYKSGSVGIKPEYLDSIKTMIAVGGGAGKAEAIILVNRGRKNRVVVTDEAAAHEILSILKGGD